MSESSGRRPPLTSEQRRALEVSGASVALSAGAGTGKTFVLAERFIRALEGPDRVPLGRVVALTFTNKAARELRERIRQECRSRLESAEDQARWRAVLRGLEAARITTFHAFCGDVLRRHAIEAGVDPGFTILEESIALTIRQEALDAALRELLQNRDRDLIHLAVEHGLGNARQSIEVLATSRLGGDLREWATREPRDLVDLWRVLWTEKVEREKLDELRGMLEPCRRLIEENAFENVKVRARLDEFLEGVALLEIPGDPIPALSRIAASARVQYLGWKLWPSRQLFEEIKTHFDVIREESRRLIKILPWDEPTTLEAAAQGVKFARIAVKARESYDRAKRSRGAIDNDDLLLIVRDLLAKPGSLAMIELQAAFDLILVDEFQDTDPVQAEILALLAGSESNLGKLYLVGDVKQSIYRFRGARPELFTNYREQFALAGRLELSANFRSVPGILAFVNALFADAFEDYSPLRPGTETIAAPRSPAIEFLWEPEPTEEDEAAKKLDSGERRKAEAQRIARHLRQRIEGDWMVVDRRNKTTRRATDGDIAFLFRSLSDTPAYEKALVDEGFDYHVVGGSGFYAQQEVLDLINVLTAVEDPLDGVALAGTLRSPFFSLSDDALFWIATERPGRLHEGLELCQGDWLATLPEADRPRAERARSLLEGWRGWKDRLPIASLVDRILTESGYEAALVGEFLGDRKRANARKLVELARRFDAEGGFALADFVVRLRSDLKGATRETQAATTDEEGEFVRLMSIHQAKGLEFPIVVVPDLDRKSPAPKSRVAFDAELGPLVNPVVDPLMDEDGEEIEVGGCLGWTIHRHREQKAEDAEALRLFYVATTRARDALVISAAIPASARPKSPALRLLDQRFDRASGRLRCSLPDGWPLPEVGVMEVDLVSRTIAKPVARPKAALIEVARVLDEALAGPFEAEPLPRDRPEWFDLDPTFGLSSTATRLDRLIRTMMTDPRSLEPSRIEAIAGWASRLQDPVAPRGLIEQAIQRLLELSQTLSPLGLGSAEVIHRVLDWRVKWPETGRATLFAGQGDFVFRRPDGRVELVMLADPDASESRETLRSLLSAVAAERLGMGTIERAWLLRPGSKHDAISLDTFDRETIERAIDRAFEATTTN